MITIFRRTQIRVLRISPTWFRINRAYGVQTSRRVTPVFRRCRVRSCGRCWVWLQMSCRTRNHSEAGAGRRSTAYLAATRPRATLRFVNCRDQALYLLAEVQVAVGLIISAALVADGIHRLRFDVLVWVAALSSVAPDEDHPTKDTRPIPRPQPRWARACSRWSDWVSCGRAPERMLDSDRPAPGQLAMVVSRSVWWPGGWLLVRWQPPGG